MPTPLGHVLAGLSIALAADKRRPASPLWPRVVVICAVLSVVPDLDLLFPGGHRKMTHSLLAVAVVFILAGTVTRLRKGRANWYVAAVCAAAYLAHIVMDWLGKDPATPAGLQILWPFVDHWFISDSSLFPNTERENMFRPYQLMVNARALALEALLVGPILLLVWRSWRRRLPAG